MMLLPRSFKQSRYWYIIGACSLEVVAPGDALRIEVYRKLWRARDPVVAKLRDLAKAKSAPDEVTSAEVGP